MNSPQTETNHLEEARRLATLAYKDGSDEAEPLRAAQVHATIAQAKALQGIREAAGEADRTEEIISYCRKWRDQHSHESAVAKCSGDDVGRRESRAAAEALADVVRRFGDA